ncbi:MAG: SDR family oxidoreductase [Betaproteobacteria bacterium]|nr:SDR family oxidoreductase [Betaproteobacteria bacterium]
MGSFDGKVALLTGAGSGIARASAKMFATEGAKVVIAEIVPELGAATEQAIREAGGEALFVRTDVTDEESVRAAFHTAVKRYGRLDILHNCAGGSVKEDNVATEVDMSVWEHTISLDLKGTFLCCRHGIPEIAKSGGGSVINMTSWLGLMGAPWRNVYATAKGGIISLTKTLAGEFAHKGVRVNAIAPGAIRTERSIRKYGAAPPANPTPAIQYRMRLAERYPFSTGQPEDVAHIVLFLASEKSRLINGAVIAADGGRSAYL